MLGKWALKWTTAVGVTCLGFLVASSPKPGFSQSSVPPAKIFKDAKPSVVVIYGDDSSGKIAVQGSGFIVAHNRVVTNHHVVSGKPEADVVFSDGQSAKVTAVVGDNPSADLTILEVETGARPSLAMGDDSALQQGDPVYALGAPQGLDLTFTNGIVSAFRHFDGQFLIQTTAPIGHGSSGGPLFDESGKLVGITSAFREDTPGVYYSVGVDDLKHLLKTPEFMALPLSEWSKNNPDKESTTNNETLSQPEEIEKLLHDKKYDEAKVAIDAFLARSPNDEVAHRLNGELNEETGNADVALKELARSVQQNPKDAVAQFFYALTLFEKHRFGAALEHELRSHELVPMDSELPFLSVLYYSTRDYAEAQSFASKALTSNPNDEYALGVLTGAAFNGFSHKDQTWKELAQRISETNPDSFWPHILHAAEAYAKNQEQQAQIELKAAEKSDFPDPAAYTTLAFYFARSGQLDLAEGQVKDGLASMPNDPRVLAAGVIVSLRRSDRKEAEKRFAILESADGDSIDTQNTGCLYYYATDRTSQALRYCARSIQLSPESQTAHSNYAWAKLDAGQYSSAFQEFMTASRLASANARGPSRVESVDILWGAAVSKFFLGDRPGAQSYLKQIRELYPEGATLDSLQRMPLLWSATSLGRVSAVLRDSSMSAKN